MQVFNKCLVYGSDAVSIAVVILAVEVPLDDPCILSLGDIAIHLTLPVLPTKLKRVLDGQSVMQ